jgi:DNA-3-methyladenine glycosylase II
METPTIITSDGSSRAIAAGSTELTVRFDGPIDYAASLEMFRRSGDDLLDRWDGRTFARTIIVDKEPSAFACTFGSAGDALDLHMRVENVCHRDEIERIVRGMFIAPTPHFAELTRRDAVIAALHARYPGVRSVRQSNLFNALLRCISTQQVNLRWAATCRRRLAETFGRLHNVGGTPVHSLDPERMATLEIADIRALQFTNSKAEYVINVARVIAGGELTTDILDQLTSEDIVSRLTAIRGIGLWSAEWILARTLGRPHVVGGDLGVRKAVRIAYFGGTMPSESDVRRATAHWGESAAVAQALLLHALAEKTLVEIVASANAVGAIAPSTFATRTRRAITTRRTT